jgi:DinB superfamily
MDKEALKTGLTEKHENFIRYIGSLKEDEFLYSFQDKWNAGQLLDHIIRSASPVSKGFDFFIKATEKPFAISKHTSRTFDEVVTLYKEGLSKGAKASGKFIPEIIPFDQRERLMQDLSEKVNDLNTAVSKMSEEQLDGYVMPHPVLGDLTFREMIYFTMYHVVHHETNLKKYLSNKSV